MKKLLLALFIMASPAYADIKEWDNTTKIQFGITSALAIGDAVTTIQALKNPNTYELNPLLGKRPTESQILAFTALSIYGSYKAYDSLNENQRTVFFVITSIARAYAINNNIGIAVELKF